MKAKMEQAKSENKTLRKYHAQLFFFWVSWSGKKWSVKKLNIEPTKSTNHSTGNTKSKHTICIKTIQMIKSATRL